MQIADDDSPQHDHDEAEGTSAAALWQDYRSTHDKELLLLHYSPLVQEVAGRLAVQLPAFVERADLVSYGILGLIDAIERYDPPTAAPRAASAPRARYPPAPVAPRPAPPQFPRHPDPRVSAGGKQQVGAACFPQDVQQEVQRQRRCFSHSPSLVARRRSLGRRAQDADQSALDDEVGAGDVSHPRRSGRDGGRGESGQLVGHGADSRRR